MEKLAYIVPVAACLYLLFACWSVRAFFEAGGDSTRERRAAADFVPPVSILKPVKGLDPGAYENFASFCVLDYPAYEVLFAVADPRDPAVAVIERVQQDLPKVRVRLLTGVAAVTPNPKVSSLVALTKQAAHDILVISDSDMRVDPDYLRRVIEPLAREDVGLVTCCYRGSGATGIISRLEALYMGLIFLPQVVVARRFLDMRFAMGATMAVRRRDLEASGGWESTGAFLAEDNQLALQITTSGKRVILSQHVVDAFLGTSIWREQWNREVRWARTNRVNRPQGYAGIILTLGFPLALIFLPVDGAGVIGWSLVGAALALRWVTAWLIAGYTGDRALRRWLPWLPIRDLLSTVIWCAGLAGRRVVWRGRAYYLDWDGRIEGTDPETAHAWWRLPRLPQVLAFGTPTKPSVTPAGRAGRSPETRPRERPVSTGKSSEEDGP